MLRGLITLPLTVSYLIIGMGLLVLFNAAGVPKSLLAAGIGHVVINLPLCFAIIYSQMGDHQINIERAARDLGAPEWKVLVLVTVPVMAPALFASFFLSMTFSWDEFVISFLLTRFDTTLPVEIWNLLRSGLNPKTNAVGSLVFAVSIVLVMLFELLLFRGRSGMSGPLVDIRNVSHRFGSQAALSEYRLTIDAGSYTVLLGPSGSGKTTLLSILGGFLVPSEGKVFIRGEDCTALPPARRPTTTVFQDYALFPHMSVGSNVGFGLRMQGVASAERAERAREALALVGLAGAFDKKPHQLSGGQRQRVALARALVVEPAVLLLDEPLGALDLKLRRQMQDELKAIQKRVGTAFVHVTHDQEEAMALADHCVVMNDGRIEDEGPPERVYARPATRFSATFMGESTMLSGEVTGDVRARLPRCGRSLGDLSIPGAQSARVASVWRSVRNISVSARARAWLPLGSAMVRDVVFQGSFKRVLAVSQADPQVHFIAKGSGRNAVAPATWSRLFCRPDDIILLER